MLSILELDEAAYQYGTNTGFWSFIKPNFQNGYTGKGVQLPLIFHICYFSVRKHLRANPSLENNKIIYVILKKKLKRTKDMNSLTSLILCVYNAHLGA